MMRTGQVEFVRENVRSTMRFWTDEETQYLLRYIAEGMAEKEAADQLGRSLLSVRGRMGTLRQFHAVPNNTALIATCIREGRI